ncbi:hypothetical protein KSF78_0002761 [Schistosoma japonicum]|nr:hypothetical protein KSF78_0002761 [Schistosoma japonicum]
MKRRSHTLRHVIHVNGQMLRS